MQIQKKQMIEEVTKDCAGDVLSQLTQNSRPMLFLVSGGSCLQVLSSLFLRKKERSLSFSHVTVSAVDERYDVEHSNYREIANSLPQFIETITHDGGKVIDTSQHFPTLLEEAHWYNDVLKSTIHEIKKQDGRIVTLLGIGHDGHTAGIFPFSKQEEGEFYKLFLDTDQLIVGYDAGKKSPFKDRFTATYPLLSMSDDIIVYAVGEEKQNAINKLQDVSVPLHTCPAAFLSLSDTPVTLYTTE